jgi:hypothetical protein
MIIYLFIKLRRTTKSKSCYLEENTYLQNKGLHCFFLLIITTIQSPKIGFLLMYRAVILYVQIQVNHNENLQSKNIEILIVIKML